MGTDDSFRWVLDDLPVGVWVATAPDGQVVYVNVAFQEILGMSAVADSRIGDAPQTYGIFNRAGQPFPVEQLPFSRALATSQPVTVDDIVIHRPDGGRANVRAFGRPVRDATGTVTHIIVTFWDITREVQAELGRTSVEALLHLAVDHSPVILWSTDGEGIVTLSEGAGLKALGVRPGGMVGQSLFELYREHPTIPGNIRRALAGESFWHSGRVGEAVFDSWMTPLRNAGGEIVGTVGLSNDTTDIRRLQAGIIQGDRVRAVGTLAASVAHEINNPLMYVLGCLGTLERTLERQLVSLEGAPDATALASARGASVRMRDEIATIRKGVEGIASITRDLKTFSRSDDARLEPVDVRKVVESVLKLVRKEVEARARLRLALQDVPAVMGSEARLVQVLLNLLLNAAQSLTGSTPERDEVSLTLGATTDRVLIEVGDTGPGVPIAERERIFEPFVTTKPIGEGTGLGLFVCRNIVRNLAGEISVHDQPGGGALFRVSLPAAAPFATVTAAPAPPVAAHGTGRVLVIDDEPLVARLIASQVEEAGFGAEVATDAAQAMEMMLGPTPFDLIYCDLMMKGMTGMDIAAALETQAPERLARMVFMTGGAFVPRASAFVSMHRDRCIEKPFDAVEETRRRLSRSSPPSSSDQ
jgi:two-component system, cell cycle sensor histidine kinase and response regulator CckA